MNVILWLLAGAAAGWISCSLLDLSAARCLVVSTIMGFVGVIFGGDALAPAIGAGGEASVLSSFAVLVACVSAMGCLKIARTVKRSFRSRLRDQQTLYELP